MIKKKVFGIVILCVVIIAGWQIYSRTSMTSQKMQRPRSIPVAVEVTPVQQTTICEMGMFTGTLLPESQYIVAPKISGRLEKLFVNIGDAVKRDQLIALIDDDEFIQQVDQARAELDVARANIEENRSALSLAEREYERAQSLRTKKIVSESELDAAEAEFKTALARQKVAVAQVAQKEAELKTAQVRLDYSRIKTAWEDGNGFRVVGERFVDEGTMLTANTPIVSIIDISCLRAVIYVIERDYPRIKMGQPALVTTDAFPGRTFKGEIARIAPFLKEAARQARVEIDIPNADRLLKPGMFVRVSIEYECHENATVVPMDALIKNGEELSIFLADRDQLKVQRIPVTLGIISGNMAEIVKPAVSGFVVTMGQHLLENGAAISLPETTEKPSS